MKKAFFLLSTFLCLNLSSSSFVTGNIKGGGVLLPSGPVTPPGPQPSPAPTVSSVSPTAGALAGGGSLSINGTNFYSGATAKVGVTTCTSPIVASEISMSCTLPAKSAGTYDVTVTNTDTQSGTLSNAYTYQAAPTISSVSPTAGALAGGTSLTINGTGFLTGITATVGGTTCTSPNRSSSILMSCTLPAKSAGTYDVVVTNTDSQTGTKSNGYTYQPAPTVASVAPTSGATGGSTAVTITGTGFVSGATATIGGVTCTSPNVTNSTTLTCTTGAHAAGTVDTIVTNSDGQSGTGSNTYTYAAFAPTDIASLKAWFDGSDTSYMYTDTGCTTNVTTDGDNVKCWKDKTANAWKATEASSNPVYKTNKINGKSVVYFNSKKLTTDATIADLFTQTAWTAFAVIKNITYPTGSADGTIYANAAIWMDSGGQFGHMLQSPTNNVAYGNGGLAVVKETLATNTAGIIMMRVQSGNLYISKNGGSESSVSVSSISFTGTNVVKLGINYAAANANSEIADLYLFNAAVGSSDISSMYSYLNSKWAIY